MKKSRGVTLLELSIAMAVALVAVGIIFITVSGNNNDHRILENASYLLQADIRYAQNKAIMEGRRIGVHFEPRLNRYHIVSISPQVTYRTVYLEGVTIIYVNYVGNRLHFLPRGTIYRPGTIWLEAGRYQQRITTTFTGGQVIVYPIITNAH